MADWVRSRENSLSNEDSRCPPRCGEAFSWLVRASSSRMVERRRPRSCRIRRQNIFLREQAEEQMLGANVLVREALGFSAA